MIETEAKQASKYLELRHEDHSWDYRGEPTKRYTQGIHSYPAMMIPQVAARLIKEYSKEGDTLLDPFCGSGSVLVEAKIAKRHSWGIDLNPLAILIATVKTNPINPSILNTEYYELVERIYSTPNDEVSSPEFFNIDYWFKPSVIRDLAKIKAAIDRIDRTEIKQFFLVTFSEVIRLSSNSRSHEFKLFRYSGSRLENHWPNVMRLFREHAEANICRIQDFYEACPSNVKSELIQADSTKSTGKIEPDSVDIVVTSPPYGDSRTTVAYGQFCRLSSQWIGLLPEKAPDIDREMLGGNGAKLDNQVLDSPLLSHVTKLISEKDSRRAQHVYAFYVDLFKALENIAKYVRHGGHACIVIGNRRVKGIQLPTDAIICELSQGIRLTPLHIAVRNIPSKTMPLKNSPTNVAGIVEETMHKECILILKKS